MKVHEFMHEMKTTSAILGRSSGISVVFEGDQASTDGKRITLPALPQQVDLTQEQVLVMRGFVDHEAGHNRHSNMPRIISFYDKNHHNGRPELNHIHNSLEDIWMEEEVLDEYPGAWKNLRQAQESSRHKDWLKMQEVGKEAVDQHWSTDLNAAASAGIIVNKNEDFHTPHNELVRSWMSDKQQEMGAHYADLARACSSSDELIELAKKIFQYNEETDQEDQSPDDFDEKAEEGQLSDMEGEEREGENSPGFDPNDPNGKGEAAARKGAAQGQEKGEGDPLEATTDISEVLNDADEDGVPGGIGKCMDNELLGGYRVASTKADKYYKRGGKSTPGGQTDLIKIVEDVDHWSAYDSRKADLKSDVMVMKNKLRRSVMAKQQRDWDFGREMGRLDSKRLVAASQGVRQVYKRRTDRDDYNTAISILVDLSGSMHGRKVQVARDCAIALSECFEGTQISYRISGFSNNSGCGSHPRGKYHRYERLDHTVFKDFDDNLRQTRGSVYLIPEAIGGNNSDYDFVDKELYDLSRRSEERKVLFVLSDGRVACSSDAPSSEHNRLIKENLAYYKSKYGVESVGLGILDSSVSHIYKDNVVVNDVSDLSRTVFNKLTDILFREKVS